MILSWLKLVQDYPLSCTWESCYLGGLSRWGILDSLEIRRSACNVLVYCIHMSKKKIEIYKLWFEFQRSNIYSSVLTLSTSFLVSNRSKFGLILCLKDQLCVIAGLVEIQLAEDYSSVRVLELVPVTWKYMRFAQFWSSPWISWAIWMNKFLSGEFHVFCGKMIIIGFGRCHGNLAVK